ncbi:MAG TPA: 4-(cytidine 5'-diphospho)-2-C-methyl-D-erythritol kinase [Atribacterota bacterium]|nr:4-(cytidine 5'-diphospho)-2-C-methyl-D-erythritol kinase [Atribacterota bacterium]
MSHVLKLKSYAKINLYLDIGPKLDDGYHRIDTIMQTVNLYDELFLEPIKTQGIFIQCNDREVPVDKNSIIYRTAEMLLANTKKGIKVFLNKRIPIASGLGGGSSNIATILIGINKLFKLSLDRSHLTDIAANLGIDIPFFIIRGTVLARGRGEQIFPLKPIHPSLPLILVNPGIKILTKWAYHLYDQSFDKSNKPIKKISHYLKKKEAIKPIEIYQTIYNSFDSVMIKEYPVIEQIKNMLKDLGAIAATISGSGSTVYGVFAERKQRDKCYSIIKDKYPFVYRTRTVQARNIIF